MRRVQLLLLFFLEAAPVIPVLAQAGGLQVDGTQLLIADEHGERLPPTALVGLELDLPDLGTIRVLGIERDSNARFDEIWLHTLELRANGTTEFAGFCEPDPLGDQRVVLYPGYFDQTGSYVADPQRFSMSCVSGVEAKCLRWGYLPWRQAPTTGELLAPYFEACIRLARADYCGDDRPSTRNGTTIDVYDRVGVQNPESDPGDLRFEAGWKRDGAVCVAHTRIAANLSLNGLGQQCPHLATKNLGEPCTEDRAAASGALLFNRSHRNLPDDDHSLKNSISELP